MPVLSLEEFGNLDKEQLKEFFKRDYRLIFEETCTIDKVLDDFFNLGNPQLKSLYEGLKKHCLPLYITDETFRIIIYQNKKAADSYYN